MRSIRLGAAVGVVAVSLACAAWAIPAAAHPAWPTHRCSTFKKWVPPDYGVAGFYYHITVYNRHVRCAQAVNLIKKFWSGKAVHHGGSSDAASWWTLPGYPGWKCRQGAGAGSCTRKHRIAAYEVKI